MENFLIKTKESYENAMKKITENCEITGNLLTDQKKHWQRWSAGNKLKPYNCTVSENKLTISKATLHRNSFALHLELEIFRDDEFTFIKGDFKTHILPVIFLLVLIAPCAVFSVIAFFIQIYKFFAGGFQIAEFGAVMLFVFGVTAFASFMYFGGRKFSEPNARELKKWIYGLFPDAVEIVEEK